MEFPAMAFHHKHALVCECNNEKWRECVSDTEECVDIMPTTSHERHTSCVQ